MKACQLKFSSRTVSTSRKRRVSDVPYVYVPVDQRDVCVDSDVQSLYVLRELSLGTRILQVHLVRRSANAKNAYLISGNDGKREGCYPFLLLL